MSKNNIELGLIFICVIIYFVTYGLFITGSSFDPEIVSTTEIVLSIFGFILGLWISAYLHRTIFNNEQNDGKNIWTIGIIGIVSIIMMSFAIIANMHNVKGINSSKWIQYDQILFPLYGGLILISEESLRHFIHYMLSEKKYDIELSFVKRSENGSRNLLPNSYWNTDNNSPNSTSSDPEL